MLVFFWGIFLADFWRPPKKSSFCALVFNAPKKTQVERKNIEITGIDVKGW